VVEAENMKRLLVTLGVVGAAIAIIRWYDHFVQRLPGPKSGDERGPAKEPPWIKQAREIVRRHMGRDAERWPFGRRE
jgi:hypothetical protein